jgi:two-component system response regulator
MELRPAILTTSVREEDIATSYDLKVNCYLEKPVELEAFETLVKTIHDFWLVAARLPAPRSQAARDR